MISDGKTDAVADQGNITRVAWTLVYGGIENVGILDGGQKAHFHRGNETKDGNLSGEAK